MSHLALSLEVFGAGYRPGVGGVGGWWEGGTRLFRSLDHLVGVEDCLGEARKQMSKFVCIRLVPLGLKRLYD
jgi:hypothetical protein